MSLPPDAFIVAARSYLGVRWHHMGRTREAVDCIGLLLLAAEDCGMTPPIPAPYAKGHRGPTLMQELRRIGRVVNFDERRPGDLLAFRDGRYVAHLGILTSYRGADHVVHAHAGIRQVIEQPLAGMMMSTLVAIVRPQEFDF